MGIKILIVEDEFIVANGLRLVLEQAGHMVNGIAGSAAEADENLQKQTPDLVLLDIRLEGKRTGIDLARKLRAENIAFIYLSANSSQKVLEEATATEPYGFLVKPFREKDLLVAIDIACYRHKHSLESRLRQEELLEKQLVQIKNDAVDAIQKQLRLAHAVQSYIPFDMMVSSGWPRNNEYFTDVAYLRVGFDEYQYIGEQELINVTGIKKDALSAIVEESHTTSGPVIYNSGTAHENPAITSLQRIFFDNFKIASYLAFPVVLSDGSLVHYFFYSRQRDIYTRSHLALLYRLKIGLIDLTENMRSQGISAGAVVQKPKLIIKRPNGTGDHSIFSSIIGKHPLLLCVLDLTAQVAPFGTSVLILGESGTGKEKIAHAIHSLSTRKNGPFIKVNCAAIPATLVESELFGHERGAFTGAVEKRKGRFEQADGGTIFLDEVGELPLEMQVKLLRVLQEREIEPVGASSFRKVNVRVVAATNRNLEKEVADGNFRLDLYYRLNVFPITLPPLRERKSDIAALTLFFANKYCTEFNKAFVGISPAMIDEMYAYSWPGNIRELENVLEQSVILNDGQSKLELKRSLTVISTEFPERVHVETLADVRHIQRETEREYIISVLKRSEGRIRGTNGAAELLNIKPTTLESKMAKLGIKKEDI